MEISLLFLFYCFVYGFSLFVFVVKYFYDTITMFELNVLAFFWPITVPFILLKTLIKAIKKI